MSGIGWQKVFKVFVWCIAIVFLLICIRAYVPRDGSARVLEELPFVGEFFPNVRVAELEYFGRPAFLAAKGRSDLKSFLMIKNHFRLHGSFLTPDLVSLRRKGVPDQLLPPNRELMVGGGPFKKGERNYIFVYFEIDEAENPDSLGTLFLFVDQ